jgi:hypothetical protein
MSGLPDRALKREQQSIYTKMYINERSSSCATEVSQPWRHPSEPANVMHHPACLAHLHQAATRWLQLLVRYCHKLHAPPSSPTSSILSNPSSIVPMAFCAGCCPSLTRQALAPRAHLAFMRLYSQFAYHTVGSHS